MKKGTEAILAMFGIGCQIESGSLNFPPLRGQQSNVCEGFQSHRLRTLPKSTPVDRAEADHAIQACGDEVPVGNLKTLRLLNGRS